MAIDPTKLSNLKARTLTEKIQVAEIVKVYWDDETTKYYSIKPYDQMPEFDKLSLRPIEPKLITDEGFSEFTLNGDLNDAEFELEFLDLDRSIKALFQVNGTVKCELYYYYPAEDLLTDAVWWGRLEPPTDLSSKILIAKASNGMKSNQLKIPHRNRPKECIATFGGALSSLEEIRTGLCPYNKHLGGSVGTEISPGVFYTSCPRNNKGDCNLRLGTTDGKYYPGYEYDESTIVVDPDAGYSSQSQGNRSRLKSPIRVIAGFKILRDILLLSWRKEPNISHPDTGWVAILWEVGEGPVDLIQHPFVNGQLINPQHYSLRYGTLGQSRTPYSPTVHNYSGTAVAFTRFGQVNPNNYSLDNLKCQITVKGYNQVREYSDSETFLHTWDNNRVWWIMEMYTNLKFGLGYSYDIFDTDAFIDGADWVTDGIKFTDDDAYEYILQRSQFDCIIEGLNVQEQITNICRSGRISVPFQFGGKYTIQPLKKATTEELGAAPVFDASNSVDILKNSKGLPDLSFSQIPADELVNTIDLTFEDYVLYHKERPIKISNSDQQARAGKALGKIGFEEIPRSYNAYGIVRYNEAVYLGYSLLWFGDFDKGGIKNNLRAIFRTTYINLIGLKKYQIIKIISDELDGYEDPDGNQFEYFRIIDAFKLKNNEVRVTAQAYNPDAYDLLETPYIGTIDPDEPIEPIDPNEICQLQLGTVSYDEDTALLTVPVEPC